jgi:hypothetical protein
MVGALGMDIGVHADPSKCKIVPQRSRRRQKNNRSRSFPKGT